MALRRPPKLRRARHMREPRRRFILFCEGKNTEPAYFGALKRKYTASLIDIEILGPAGTPHTIASKARAKALELGLTRRSKKKLDSFEEKDQIWAVFDRDEHPKFEEAISICNDNGIYIARSNPCFEIWIILHIEEYDKPDGRQAAQKHLEKILPEYQRDGAKTPDCAGLLDKIESAEQRAKKQIERRADEGNPHGPPSTTAGSLSSAIRDAARRSAPSPPDERR